MVLAGVMMMALLIGMWIYSNWSSEYSYYINARQAYFNGLLFTGAVIAVLVGAIILIHKLGGVKIRDIPAYQNWCQDEFKKEKKNE